MSRVDFAHGATHRLRAACRTAARHARAGHRLLVYCTDPRRLQRFDSLLWAFEPCSFVPHVACDDPLAAHAPVLLVASPVLLAQATDTHWLLNLDLDCPPQAERFARILEIVSGHEGDRQAARQRWMHYKAAGHDLRSHSLPTPGTSGAG